MPYIKNFPHAQVRPLAQEVAAQPGQIVSRTLAQNPYVSVTLFAFAEGEEISTHDSAGDAMVQVLEGTGRFTVGGEEHLVHAGEALVMPGGDSPRGLCTGGIQNAADRGVSHPDPLIEKNPDRRNENESEYVLLSVPGDCRLHRLHPLGRVRKDCRMWRLCRICWCT